MLLVIIDKLLTLKKWILKKLGSQKPESETAPGKKFPEPPQIRPAPKPWVWYGGCYDGKSVTVSKGVKDSRVAQSQGETVAMFLKISRLLID